jgi:hypothetical protein
MTAIRFVSRPRFGDLVRLTVEQTFRSVGAQAVHGFGWGVAGFGLVYGIPADVWGPPALLAVVFGTGLYGVVFQWLIFGRRPERLTETVTADEQGIVIEGPDNHVRHPWSMYREARETPSLFILGAVRTLSQVLAKRGVSEAALEEFRGFLRTAGLLRERPGPARGILGFVVGALIALALPFVAGIATIR